MYDTAGAAKMVAEKGDATCAAIASAVAAKRCPSRRRRHLIRDAACGAALYSAVNFCYGVSRRTSSAYPSRLGSTRLLNNSLFSF